MVLDTIQVTWIAALGLPITIIFAAVSCLFCFRKKNGFSNFSSNANTVGSNQGHHNTTFTLEIPDAEDEVGSNTVIVEPLPISPRRGPLRPRIVSLDGANQNSSLKLLAHHAIPRSHLTYLKELGSGWFGKAIESSAERLISGVPISTVVVKMLKDDASKTEQKLFIEEVAPFREIEHTNILRLLGECTEMNPMLMVLEASPYGDLKQYLRSHQQQRDQLLQKNRLIQFATDAACGLACLHRHDYLHRDLAARNCLVMGNHVVKIGDYGFAEEAYQEDYFRSSNHLLPIRWMAPETLKKEKEIWVASNFSKESDIWSLGVLLWEIAMLGERPYDMLTDKAVLQGVIVEKVIRLPEPEKGAPQRDKMYEVMKSCWLERGQRTKVDDLHSLLQQAAVQSASLPATTIPDFESKWMHLVPNQRHASLDSKESHLASFSSTDTDLLAEEILSSNSFDNLTELEPSPKVMPAPVHLKKVSASELRTPVAGQLSQPNISAAEDMKETAKGSKEVAPAFVSQAVSAENVEFTDFTSFEWADAAATNEASLSQTTTKLLPADLPVTAVSAGEDGVEEPLFKSTNVPAHEARRPMPNIDVADLKVPSLSPLGGTAQSASYSLSETPFRPKPTPRKTSTPVVRESQSTVDSQASASAGSSFLTAMESSQHTNTSDYFTTANNSTNSSEQSSGEMLSEVDSESSFACFEMLDTTTVGHNHAEDMGEFVSGISTAEVSAQSRTADSFFSADVPAQQMSEKTKIGESKDDSFGEYTSPDMENMYAPEISADAELKIKNSLSTGDTADLFPSLFAAVKPTAVDGAGDTLAFCSPEEKHEDYKSVGNKAAISKLPDNQVNFNSEGDTSANGSQADVSSDFKSFGLDLSDFGSLTDGIISSDKLLQEPVLLGSPNVSPHFDYQEFSCATTTPEQADGVESFMSHQADQVKETLSAGTAGSSFTGGEHLVSGLGDFESFSFTSYDAANLPDQSLIEDTSTKADTGADKSNSAAGTQNICADFLDSLVQIGDPQQHSQTSFQDEASSPLLDQSAVSLDENISLFHTSENDKQVTQPSEQPVVAFDIWSDFSFSSAGLQPLSEPFSSKGGMPLESDGVAAAAAVPDKVGQSLKVECQDDNVSGCESESSFLSTDSDSSDSDGIREYICREPWEKEPSPASVSSNGDSEEYALQIASEIYLSKGLKMTRSFETPSLEPIPEDPLPSVSEESAPTPSETSSLDVRVEDVFEWDDFMGESLVGEEHTSDSSPKRSFDMLEWSMDTESDTFPSSTTSVFSQRSEDLRGSFGSDLHGTVLGKVGVRSSHSDSEVTLYGRSQAHRLYLSELANRTKERRILPITSPIPPIHSQDQSRFYSLFHDEFDLESDSMSEGSNGLGETHFSVESPSQSTAQGKVEVSPLHDETHLPSLLHDFDPSGSGLNTCPEDSKPGITDGSQPPNPSLDLSALESADSGVTSTSDTDQMSTSTPGTNGASLIDF